MLVSVAGEAPAQTEADPIMSAFLSFLSADILRSPDGVKPLGETRIKKTRELTKGTKIRDDGAVPDDVTL